MSSLSSIISERSTSRWVEGVLSQIRAAAPAVPSYRRSDVLKALNNTFKEMTDGKYDMRFFLKYTLPFDDIPMSQILTTLLKKEQV